MDCLSGTKHGAGKSGQRFDMAAGRWHGAQNYRFLCIGFFLSEFALLSIFTKVGRVQSLVFDSLTPELTLYGSEERQNTKHQALDEFEFLGVHQFFIAEFLRLRKMEQIVDISSA